jgi:general secretion pathway protein A
MFLEFFGLREQPFGMTPDPAYLYAGKTHSDAHASLALGIEDNRGFLALIAPPGMGKTTLLYRLMEELRDTTRTVLVSQTQCTSHEFIEYILHELCVETKGMGLVAMHGKLNEILFEELLAGKRFVLVVDEAQNLDDSVLETVRMLSNFETHNTKLLQIILAGQPPLAVKLAQPRLSQLRQRIAVLSHLEPFGQEETALYIWHRMKIAGCSAEQVFDMSSIRLIARHSKGIPRIINNLCYTSLLLAHARNEREVTGDIVQEAIGRLDVESLAYEPLPVTDFAADEAGLAPPAPEPPAPEPPASALAVRASVAPVRLPAVPTVGVSGSPTAPASAPASKDRRPRSYLTYDAGKKVTPPKWPARSATVTIILLTGILLLAILGRSESRLGITPTIFNHSYNTLGALMRSDRTEGTSANYNADPQDTESGQVITVAAGPLQTLKDLSLRYVGHFDDELAGKIQGLNPGLTDPDHLEAGQLIRIPLPPGAMKKANDTADAAGAPAPSTSSNLFTRFTALLRDRK